MATKCRNFVDMMTEEVLGEGRKVVNDELVMLEAPKVVQQALTPAELKNRTARAVIFDEDELMKEVRETKKLVAEKAEAERIAREKAEEEKAQKLAEIEKKHKEN